MIGITLGSLKKTGLFSKKEKKQNKIETMLHILDKIEKESPEKRERLQDIRIDLIERIPLTNDKKIFLKDSIDMLKKSKIPSIQKKLSETDPVDFNISNPDKSLLLCKESLESIHLIIKEINAFSNTLYKESDLSDEFKINHIKECNNTLQNSLRNIISNLHMTHSNIIKQINEAKSLQTKMSILDNELELKRSCLK